MYFNLLMYLIPFSALSSKLIPSYVKPGQYFLCRACLCLHFNQFVRQILTSALFASVIDILIAPFFCQKPICTKSETKTFVTSRIASNARQRVVLLGPTEAAAAESNCNKSATVPYLARVPIVQAQALKVLVVLALELVIDSLGTLPLP